MGVSKPVYSQMKKTISIFVIILDLMQGNISHSIYWSKYNWIIYHKQMNHSDFSDNEILDLIESVLKTKKASHGGMDYLVENREKNRPMTSIGG